MKNTTVLCVSVLILAIVFTGCKKKSDLGGGAGSDTFRIVVPAMPTDVKQGETQTLRVSVERGNGFKQQVSVEVEVPVGIQVEPVKFKIEASDKGDVQLAITASDDAAIGEHKILIKATPDKGESTETEFKISIVAK